MNNVMNICVQVFFVDIFFILLGINLWQKLLGLIVTPCLLFRGTSRLFSMWLVPFTFPPVAYEGSNFFTSLQTLIIIFF
jgi:hypothetical protein